MSQIDIIDELKGIAQYLGDNGMTTCLRVVNRAIKEIQGGRDYTVEEVNRIKAELQKTLNAGAVWETACLEAEQENAKLREELDEIISMRDAAESHVIRLRAENAKLRESLAVAERLCLASSHLLKGAESIYDPRGDVGPTHWMGTCDKLIAELDRVVGKYA